MKTHVLIVDDEKDIRELIQDILEDEGFEVSLASNGQTAFDLLKQITPDLILLDIWMPEIDGITLIKQLQAEYERLPCPIIMMSGHGTVEHAVEAIRIGAYDFLEKPLSIAKLLLIIQRALETSRLQKNVLEVNSDHKDYARSKRKFERHTELIGQSQVMQVIRERLIQIAQLSQTPVILWGESGVGKQTCARYLHEHSPRKLYDFVVADISALPAQQVVLTLVGHDERDQIDHEPLQHGLLRQAHGGTIYLKDIDALDLECQAKLMAILSARFFIKKNEHESVPLDVRWVVGSLKSLQEKVTQGQFREDLFYYFNVIPLHIPALQAHNEDVPTLLSYYVDYFLENAQLQYRRFSVAAQNKLRNYAWPGNIRELKSLVQRLMIFATQEDISLSDVEKILALSPKLPKTSNETYYPMALHLPLKEAREQFERHYLIAQYKASEGNIAKLAHKVGMERTNLYRKLRALDINPKGLL